MFLGRRARPGYAGLALSKPMLLSVLMPIMASGLPIACIALLQFASPQSLIDMTPPALFERH